MKSPFAILATALLIVTTTPAADSPPYKRHIPEKLAAEASISEAAAVSTARLAVPQGKVVAVELERERGKLMYSIDLQIPSVQGVEEVEVDARDGRVLAMEHESPAKEKAEAEDKKQGAQRP